MTADLEMTDRVRWFAAFLAWHIALESIHLCVAFDGVRAVAYPAVFFALAGLASARKTMRIGLVGVLAAKLAVVGVTMPHTPNHGYLQLLLVVSTFIWSSGPAATRSQIVERSRGLADTVLALLVVVYLLAGVQKLAHGAWLDGEFIALELATCDSALGHCVHALLEAVHRMTGWPLPSADVLQPTSIGPEAFPLPQWAVVFVVVLSRTFVAAEIAIPLAVALRPRAPRRLLALALLQVGIGVCSWELEFMFATLGALALCCAHVPRRLAVLLALDALALLLRLGWGIGE